MDESDETLTVTLSAPSYATVPAAGFSVSAAVEAISPVVAEFSTHGTGQIVPVVHFARLPSLLEVALV